MYHYNTTFSVINGAYYPEKNWHALPLSFKAKLNSGPDTLRGDSRSNIWMTPGDMASTDVQYIQVERDKRILQLQRYVCPYILTYCTVIQYRCTMVGGHSFVGATRGASGLHASNTERRGISVYISNLSSSLQESSRQTELCHRRDLYIPLQETLIASCFRSGEY